MGLLARNPQHDRREQGSAEPLGAPPQYATGTVHHDAITPEGVLHHTQRFEQGRLVEWSLDPGPGPWALVTHGEPTDPYHRGPATAAQVSSARIRTGDTEMPMPPLDDLPDPRFEELDHVPDATARLRFEIASSPVGDVLCDVRYEEGRRPWAKVVDEWLPTRSGEPAHGAPEIHVGVSFANYLRMRTGERSSLEAIADGGTVGETRWTLLLLLHGIYQQPRYMEIYRSLPRVPEELGWWGEAAQFIPTDATPR